MGTAASVVAEEASLRSVTAAGGGGGGGGVQFPVDGGVRTGTRPCSSATSISGQRELVGSPSFHNLSSLATVGGGLARISELMSPPLSPVLSAHSVQQMQEDALDVDINASEQTAIPSSPVLHHYHSPSRHSLPSVHSVTSSPLRTGVCIDSIPQVLGLTGAQADFLTSFIAPPFEASRSVTITTSSNSLPSNSCQTRAAMMCSSQEFAVMLAAAPVFSSQQPFLLLPPSRSPAASEPAAGTLESKALNDFERATVQRADSVRTAGDDDRAWQPPSVGDLSVLDVSSTTSSFNTVNRCMGGGGMEFKPHIACASISTASVAEMCSSVLVTPSSSSELLLLPSAASLLPSSGVESESAPQPQSDASGSSRAVRSCAAAVSNSPRSPPPSVLPSNGASGEDGDDALQILRCCHGSKCGCTVSDGFSPYRSVAKPENASASDDVLLYCSAKHLFLLDSPPPPTSSSDSSVSELRVLDKVELAVEQTLTAFRFMDRMLFLEYIPELSLAIVASSAGDQVVLVRLVRFG